MSIAPVKPTITIDDLEKVDIRVGTQPLFDIGYADKITPVLAIPEKPVPSGTRAG